MLDEENRGGIEGKIQESVRFPLSFIFFFFPRLVFLSLFFSFIYLNPSYLCFISLFSHPSFFLSFLEILLLTFFLLSIILPSLPFSISFCPSFPVLFAGFYLFYIRYNELVTPTQECLFSHFLLFTC